ncbi:hypothetical protein FEM03_23235 [Phragmitibacter flavus]|uniref:Uncharacterized protein n=1 Tax=Phragmitibacter flavus TaxID=2576071 RepID=A0A5R8K7K6_9BACT|nr:hypothetical protein [Phragmitibacter flavus]TLD68320.1 hypothetical protein FEM03_23235 [Phragmitibacter flavus]
MNPQLFINYSDEQKFWRSCVQKAVFLFNRKDKNTLLCPRKVNGVDVNKTHRAWGAASERAIAHRLAIYLEQVLIRQGLVGRGSSLAVDCEYNRHLDNVKTQRIPHELSDIVEKAKRKMIESNTEEYGMISVAPDIVVHRRGDDADNCLVIELKKRSNPEIREYDELKLKTFTKATCDGFGYKLGVAVEAIDDVRVEKRKLAIAKCFANGSEL